MSEEAFGRELNPATGEDTNDYQEVEHEGSEGTIKVKTGVVVSVT